jgi:hypothetical protein
MAIKRITAVRVRTVDGVEQWAANVTRSFMGFTWVREIWLPGWRSKADALTRARQLKDASGWEGTIEVNS